MKTIQLFILALPQPLLSQQEGNNLLEKTLERQTEHMEGNTDLSELEEQFQGRRDLNRATAEELLQVPGLELRHVLAILVHRRRYGPFLKMEELQVLPGFDAPFIRSIMPWLECRSPDQQLWHRLRHGADKGRHEWLLFGLRSWPQQDKRYFLPDGAANRFLGDPIRSHIRYRYQVPGLLSFGWAAEKDAGEPWYRPGRLMDFNSIHAFIEHTGIVRRLAFGDYQYNCGQGLLLGAGLGLSQSALVMQVKRNAAGIRPFRSLNEARYLRGMAFGLAKGAWNADILFSSRRVAPRLPADSLVNEALQDFRLDLDGLHRTAAEIENSRKALEQMAAVHVSYRPSGGRLGMAVRHDRKGLDAGSGKRWLPGTTAFSLYGERTWKNLHFFFEERRNLQALWHPEARVAGLLASLHPRADISLLYRKYSPEYDAASGTGFGAFSTNEEGLYFGFQWRPIARMTVSAYQDNWVRALPAYRNSAPTQGGSRLLECSYAPDRRHLFYMRFRIQETMRNAADSGQRIPYPSQKNVQHLRFHGDYPIGKAVEMSTRVEYSFQGNKQFGGSLVYQDMQWKPTVGGWRLGLRLTVFHIPNHNGRIFAYENDLPQVFSIRGFSGSGRSTYLLLQRQMGRHARLYLRISSLRYDDATQAQSTFSGLIRFQF